VTQQRRFVLWTCFLCVAVATLGCLSNRNKFLLGVPGTSVPVSVSQVKHRMGYLDTTLHGEGWTFRTFLPPTEACGRAVAKETGARWLSGGTHGILERDGQSCESVGIGSLDEWRKRRGRPQRTHTPIPSGHARYQKVYEDEAVVFLRGRFPLLGYLGWVGGEDTIAVVPKLRVCDKPIERGQATIEYFMTGRNVLTLGSKDGRCPIEGLIKPLAPGDVGS